MALLSAQCSFALMSHLYRFVGYLEEQAVVTYTHILDKIDDGSLQQWSKIPAPDIAKV